MNKIREAQEILKAFGLPEAQQNEMSALTLLALCNIKKRSNWDFASKNSLGVSKRIMSFVKNEYKKDYAPNTRETFRRQVLHQFVQARIVDYNPDKPNLPVNSPNAHYAISKEAIEVIKTFKTKKWHESIRRFNTKVGKLSEIYAKEREINLIPLKLSNGKILKLSAGKHNQVQAAIVEQFAARFIKDGVLFIWEIQQIKIYMLMNKLYPG